MHVYAVTGASGFIGSHVVRCLLAGGNKVIALIRPKSSTSIGVPSDLTKYSDSLEFRLCDILDSELVFNSCKGCTRILHLAAQIDVAQSFRSPQLFIETNVLGTLNVLRAAHLLKVDRILVASSSEVYGGPTDGQPLNEQSPLIAKSPYAASKIAAEKLAQAYFHSYNLPVVVVRPFNTFGPGQSQRAVIPRILMQARQSNTILLGNTKPQRDFVFVEDTAKGIIAAIDGSDVEGQVFNLATGKAYSIEDVVHLVGKILRRRLSIEHNEEATRETSAEVWHLLGDASKARRDLGWAPQVPFDIGLELLIAGVAPPTSN